VRFTPDRDIQLHDRSEECGIMKGSYPNDTGDPWGQSQSHQETNQSIPSVSLKQNRVHFDLQKG